MMKSFQPLIYAVDAENITIKGEGTLDGQGKAWWTEFFRVLVDLRDNGKRNINKYQPMFEKENDRNQRRLARHIGPSFLPSPFHTSHPLQECTGRGREDYQLSLLDRKS